MLHHFFRCQRTFFALLLLYVYVLLPTFIYQTLLQLVLHVMPRVIYKTHKRTTKHAQVHTRQPTCLLNAKELLYTYSFLSYLIIVQNLDKDIYIEVILMFCLSISISFNKRVLLRVNRHWPFFVETRWKFKCAGSIW